VTGEPAAAEHRLAGSALVTSATVVATMGLGAVLALAIVLQFGKTPRTDGLLSAYGVYGLLLTLATSARASVAARLVEGPSMFANLDRLLGGAVVLALAGAVPLIALGAPVADVLTGELPSEAADSARTALAIFWIAAAAHLCAAVGAAALATRGEFAAPGFAYVAGGVAAILLMLALSGPLGIDAVAVGVAAGALLTATVIGVRLLRAGYRPAAGRLGPARAALVAARVIAIGSVGYMIAQATYVVSVAFAARLEPGDVTLYSYGFFAAMLVIGASSGTAGIVLAAPVSRSWDRRPESLLVHVENVTRGGLLLVLPALGVMALAGDELVELVLGSKLDAGDPATVAGTFLALGGLMVASSAMPVPMLAAFAKGRYGGIAWVALLTVVVHLPLSALAADLGSDEWLAAAASVSALISLVAMLWLALGRLTGAGLAAVGRELVPMALAALVAFGAAGLLGAALGGGAADVAAAVLGLALFALGIRLVRPQAWLLALRMSEPLRGR
jgi:peptidoglycan biosynthesis protein MviN/MurJ (putative lipid II flippase)